MAFIVFESPVEAVAVDQVLSQGVDTSAATLYLADFRSSDDRFIKEKKDKANDLALMMLME